MFKSFKSLVTDLTKNLFVTVILALIPTTALLSFFTGTAGFLWEVLNSATPVWALILCTVVCSLYVQQEKKGSTPELQPSEIFLIEDSDLKWRVTDHKNGYSSVDQIPLCPIHECEYIQTNGGQYMCREVFGSKCDARIVNFDDLTILWNMAKSKAQNIIIKYETRR